MLTEAEAIEIARAHLEAHPLPTTRYAWKVLAPKRDNRGWKFEYEFECLDDTPPDEWESFGGPPGFMVKFDGTVEELHWGKSPPR